MESDELDSPQQGQSARSRQASGSPNEKIISQLCLHPHYQDPQRFAWLGPRGVRIGKVDLNPDRPMDILVEEQRIPPRRVEGRLECPLAISLSEFHVLLLFPSRIQALSIYTKEVMYEDSLTLDVGVAVGLSCDPTSEFHYLFTPTTTIKYRPNDENRYVWRVFLESGEYAKALVIARARQQLDPAAYQYVLRRQADKYIADKSYTAAAEILSESTESFETIVLKFLSTDGERRGGLKLLLENKLVKCNSSSPEERMKRDAIVLWLLEEQLTELSELRKELGKQQEAAEQMAHLKRFFIKKPVLEAIQTHQKAVYRLISSHADLEVQLFLANALKDYDVALNIYLIREQYKDALDLINSLGNPKLLYAFGPKIVPYIPAQLFGSIIGNEQISPLKLFPTLVLCQEKEDMAIQALKYLEWAITTQIGEHWRELHNMIILLYARFRPKKLHQYLLDGGSNKHNLPYDLDFAIRTCVQYKQEKSLIYLYCVSELFSEAVDRALKESLDLAKECAHLMDEEDELSFEPKYPKEMRRNIWMKIAKHIITKENNAVKCIDLLKESKDALSIQDVLPLFPEFTKIEHFKEPLCECLKDHSVKIQDLQDKMKEAMQIAEEIRVKTDKLQERVIVIKSGDMCASCSKGLSGRPFYAHACRHFFHRECLEDIAMSFLNESERKKLEKLIDEEQKILQRLELNERVGSKADVEQLEMDYEKRAMAIDNLLGAECPLCGNRAIDEIDKPFFSDENYELEAETQFIISNRRLFEGSTILELGSGATGVVGITAAKIGAKRVYLTDIRDKRLTQILRRNIEQNGVGDIAQIRNFKFPATDWTELSTTDRLLAELPGLDYILASDVFYDPSVFVPLAQTSQRILSRFPTARLYFSYQNRDDNWRIRLKDFGLKASLIRICDSKRHTFQLGEIYKPRENREINKMFAGIEGGGTSSKLVFVDQNGEQIKCADSSSTNVYLDGFEKTAEHIATWVRSEAKKHNVQLPLQGLGMGLSGAEDDDQNARFVEYLKTAHGDIAEHFYLASDAVATVAANFEQGVVIIAGTGSSCRMLLNDGSVHGVGGWGHAIGDQGSAFWITNRAMRMLFDDDDGLESAPGSTDLLRELLLKHFNVTNKTGLLDFLYSKFNKSSVATFTKFMADYGSDACVAKCFFDGGEMLGRHLKAVSRHMDEELLSDVPVLVVGLVFKSWSLLKPGFISAIRGSKIRKVSLFNLTENCAFGAAVLVAKKAGVKITHRAEKQLFDTILL
ncbi:hypothetical protein WR25_03529 isoform C [Diploscapter pachys]|nr:hypothetical protein WR25_03529 isoform C [Diploscapter pachys]